jgi:hypothetical protein
MTVNNLVELKKIINLSCVIASGNRSNLLATGGIEYVVPNNTQFVLTDVIISPQEEPVKKDSFNISISGGIGFDVSCNALNPSSFCLNLTTGMIIDIGSKITAYLRSPDASPVQVSVFGYEITSL